MTHTGAYADLCQTLITVLKAVDTPESARAFTSQAVKQIKAAASQVQEFYTEEFFNIYKGAVVAQARNEMAACQQALRDAKAEASSASADLEARFEVAKANADRQAEHEVWRERDVRQAACQAKVDRATKRIDALNLQLDTCPELASALGISFN